MVSPVSPAPTCPSCGAPVPASTSFTACPACGAPLTVTPPGEAGESLAPAQRTKLEALAIQANERLFETGAEVAERAFNLGCGMSSLVVIATGILVYFLGGGNWILTLILVIMAILAALWAIILVSDLSKSSAMRRVFREEVDPEINDFTRIESIQREQFNEIAHASLSPTAPLLLFLPPLPEPAVEENSEG